MADLYEDTAQEIVVSKAGQIGVSEWLISWMMWSADIRRCNGLYLFPTDVAMSDFSAARFGPAVAVDASPYLADLLAASPKDGVGRRSSTDRVGLKDFGGSFLFLRGGKVQKDGRAPQLRSIDCDTLVLDEFDEMDMRAPPLARERLGHSEIADVRIVSTPTFEGAGIHSEYLASDQRVWHVRCRSCSTWQDLTIDDLVIAWDEFMRPIAWNVNSDGHEFLACRKCGGEMDRAGEGEWVVKHPSRPVHGYHVSRLFVPYRHLHEIITNLRKLNELIRQQVYNQALGVPYASLSSYKLTDDVLNACRRDYSMGLTLFAGRTVCGVDVGGNVLYVIIRTKMPNGSWKLTHACTVGTFDELGRLLSLYSVDMCVVDMQPESRSARRFQKQMPRGKVWLGYFASPFSTGKGTSPVEWKEDKTKSSVIIDRTWMLDEVFGLLIAASKGEAGLTLPVAIKEVPGYYKHLKMPKRETRIRADETRVAVYTSSGADHFALAEAYCRTATYRRVAAPGPYNTAPLLKEPTWPVEADVVDFQFM